jgi:hypothetical protein
LPHTIFPNHIGGKPTKDTEGHYRRDVLPATAERLKMPKSPNATLFASDLAEQLIAGIAVLIIKHILKTICTVIILLQERVIVTIFWHGYNTKLSVLQHRDP